ncbi:hypothetical protein DEIPH_ctg021orf0080 [Deinococcus phoenicis]|uniref:Toprim domain-containing protein n=1 Tax=Deinococcus phoenicis TaxID=1476583 RepID=A0A016QRH1_9DEIO|nr:hypothetical protein DEIPH_ctg021orf0080 [Deinococcus phoenicis]
MEGELNGAAAARGLEAVGVRLDVQGLAGAGGTPFLDGLAGRPVYLYADPDEAGVNCLERVGKLVRAAGAREVRVLTPLPTGDFCDLAGTEGVTALGAWLLDLLAGADLWQPVICGNPPLPQSFSALGAAQGDLWQSGSGYQKGGW